MTETFPPSQRLAAEALGTGMLVATVVGSGIMADKLAGGNVALALLGNTIPTGAMLVVRRGGSSPTMARMSSIASADFFAGFFSSRSSRFAFFA